MLKLTSLLIISKLWICQVGDFLFLNQLIAFKYYVIDLDDFQTFQTRKLPVTSIQNNETHLASPILNIQVAKPLGTSLSPNNANNLNENKPVSLMALKRPYLNQQNCEQSEDEENNQNSGVDTQDVYKQRQQKKLIKN